MITLGDCTEMVLQRLKMVEGLDAQIYAETPIMLAIQHAFDWLFNEYWWPAYTVEQEQYTLNGTTGVVTGDLSDKILRFEDLHSILWDTSDQPLALAPRNVRYDHINFPSIVPNMASPEKVFKIYPLTTSGNVYITYRTYPGLFTEDTAEIKMDHQLLVLKACYDMLESDAMNPADADKFKRFYEDRLKQASRGLVQLGTQMVPVSRTFPTRWR